MIKVGIIGGAGYTAGELIRLLINHPQVDLDFVYSTSQAGAKLSSIHHDLLGDTELCFTSEVNLKVELVFLCLGHGNSKRFLEENAFSKDTKIIDLSNDFRLQVDANFDQKDFVYGLPEFQKAKIEKANFIANPGCFATAIQLALLPLAAAKEIKTEVHIHALTGSTGAGVSPSATGHFSWRNNNISWYKPFNHQHLGEIKETLESHQGAETKLTFLPIRGNFTRGIFASLYLDTNLSLEEVKQMYKAYYESHPFTFVSDEPIHLKQVVNTNKCYLHLHEHEGKILITSCIDNLLKGASGQAVQNMNLMHGWEETMGLSLKGSYF